MGCRCGACRSDLLLKPCVGRQPCCNGALVRKIVTEIMRHFWLLRCPPTNSGRERGTRSRSRSVVSKIAMDHLGSAARQGGPRGRGGTAVAGCWASGSTASGGRAPLDSIKYLQPDLHLSKLVAQADRAAAKAAAKQERAAGGGRIPMPDPREARHRYTVPMTKLSDPLYACAHAALRTLVHTRCVMLTRFVSGGSSREQASPQPDAQGRDAKFIGLVRAPHGAPMASHQLLTLHARFT